MENLNYYLDSLARRMIVRYKTDKTLIENFNQELKTLLTSNNYLINEDEFKNLATYAALTNPRNPYVNAMRDELDEFYQYTLQPLIKEKHT